MKKIIAVSLTILIILSIVSPGYCYGPIRKLGRGVSNLLTFPLEVVNRMAEANKRSGPYEAMTYGLWEGLVNVVLRAAAGFYEVITFPFPIPEGYQPIMNDPEFLWKP